MRCGLGNPVLWLLGPLDGIPPGGAGRPHPGHTINIPESGSFGSHFSFFEIDFLVALVSEHPGN